MTIGIYALYWEEPDLVYIGQSKEIEVRFYEHLRLLKVGKHPNYKVNRVYNTYGIPTTVILETCDLKDLDILEINWMEEFDSLNSGLNIVPGGITNGRDTEHGASKYTKENILKAVSFLLDTTLSLKEISKCTKISTSVLSTIQNLSKHRWILREYPDSELEQKLLKASKIRREAPRHISKNMGKKLIHTSGNIEVIASIASFCRKYNIETEEPRICEVLSEKRSQYLGWKLLKENNEN